MAIGITVLPWRPTSWRSAPKEVTTSVAFGLVTLMVKFPSLSVEVPVVVPFTRIDAPDIGSPAGPVTLPVTTVPWLKAEKDVAHRTIREDRKNFKKTEFCWVIGNIAIILLF